MDTPQTFLWDAADHLETREDMAAYLEAALEEQQFQIQKR